jgi:peptidoglycan hydrolase-like protein with peptidoglycan-binding domain
MHFGIDVSSFQHPNGQAIDWAQASHDLSTRGSGEQPFALIKLTEGDNYLNPYALEDATNAKANGFAIAFYHFTHAEVAGAKQLAWIKQNLPSGHGIFLDIELGGLFGQPKQILFEQASAIFDDPSVIGVYVNDSLYASTPAHLLTKHLWLADPSDTKHQIARDLTQVGTGSISGIGSLTDLNTAISLDWVALYVIPAPIEATPVSTPQPTPTLTWTQEDILHMPTIEENSTDLAFVKRLQGLLNANGSTLATDGAFGPMTLREVLAFQHGHGLTADGIVGPLTWTALLGV